MSKVDLTPDEIRWLIQMGVTYEDYKKAAIIRKLKKKKNELATKDVNPTRTYHLPNGREIRIVSLHRNKKGPGLAAQVVDVKTGSPIFGRRDRAEKGSRPSIIPLSVIKEFEMKEALSVPEKHQKNIAIKTLKMGDVGASIMGGMSKDDARKFLKKIGYSDARIKKLEETKGNKMRIKESVLRKMVQDVIKEETEYQTFFKKTLRKFGAKSPADLGDKKDEFFNYIDANWDAGENETDMDETLEFPSFDKKNPLQRVKAQKRDQILKISESALRKMIKEELTFLMFSDKPSTKGFKRAKRNKKLSGDADLP